MKLGCFFDQFHANDVFPKCLLAYFVTLIQKISSPTSLKDFRPISLLGSLYKILSKVLARRLGNVMGSIRRSLQVAAASHILGRGRSSNRKTEKERK